MAELSLANVVNVSVSTPQQGVGAYSPNNLAILTNDVPGSAVGAYALYLDPIGVADDFGTDSLVYGMANRVFGQQPNILNGGGYLAVLPMIPGEVTGSTSGVPASGSVAVTVGSATAFLVFDDTEAEIQATLRTLPGLEQVTSTGTLGSSPITILTYGVYGSPTAPTVGTSTLQTSGSVAVTLAFTVTGSGETLAEAIVRTAPLVQYFGVLPEQLLSTLGSTDALAGANAVQALNKVMFLATDDSDDLEPGALPDQIAEASLSKSRCLYKGSDALLFAASYAGLALSTNFEGANTTQTMHLKSLVGEVADDTITQTLLNKALAAGVDTYPSLQGVAKVFTSGANGGFYDQIYNLGWLVGALQVAGFNYLAQAQTKIPQTEAGMTGLKGAYRTVCEQGVNNGYLAPGSWTSPTTFGNLVAFLQNVLDRGYYIFSTPVAQQSAVSRAARQAPLVQIAVKEAGAVQKSNVIVYVNP